MKRLFFVICCLIIASCHEYEIIEKPDTAVVHEPVVVTATIGQKQTKVVQEEIKDDKGNPLKIKIDWAEANESFVVIDPVSGETSTFTQTADLEDSPEIFSGVLPGQTSRSGETTYNAFYPASKYNTETLFTEQDGTLNSDMCMMSCTSDGSTFEFEHLTSIIRPVFMIEDTELTNVTSVRIWSHQIKTAEWARTASEYVDVSATCTARKDIYLYISTYVGEDDHIRSFNVEVTANGNFYIGQLNVPEGKSLRPGKFYNPTIELEESKIYTSETIQQEPAGEGTEDSPYEISDVGHLAWMANGNNLNGYYLLQSNFHIHTDVEWSFASINPFTGTIDGKGHTISGTLKASESAVFMGFVGYNAGTILDLKINADVIGSGAVTELSLGEVMLIVGGTGAVAGINMGGTVRNCETSNTTCVSIESADNGGWVSAGGLVGLNAGVLQESKNRATVQAASGLSGALAGGITGGSLGYIDSCENFGQIIGGISTNGDGPQIIGGITGLNYNGTITNSINKASAEVYGGDTRDENNSGDISYTGGIVGYQLSGTVFQCSNEAKITGCVSADCSYIGGIVGLSQYDGYNGCSISGCTNAGHIIGNGDTEYSFENGNHNGYDNSYVGDMFVGGIVGYNFSEVSTIADCDNTGDITGGYSIHSNCTAGIAGVHRGANALLYGCSNTGEITAGRSYQNYGEGNAHWFKGNIVAFNLGKVCGQCCNIGDDVNRTLQNSEHHGNEHVCETCEDYAGSEGHIIDCASHSHQ